MTEKERLLHILEQKKADRPACICPGGMMNMVTAALADACGAALPQAHCDAVQMAALAKAVHDYGCFENVGVPFCMTVEARPWRPGSTWAAGSTSRMSTAASFSRSTSGNTCRPWM